MEGTTVLQGLTAGAVVNPRRLSQSRKDTMTNTASLNRTLFLEDNLPVLRGLDSDSIDLIATDPPFNKGVPAFEGTTKAGVNVEFKDVWNWDDDVQGEWIEQIRKKHPSLFNVIHYTNAAAGDDMGAFLCFMAVRMLEMHRVLKDTGSIYLHCDPTASHYLKAMMDAIFGRKQFQNEIVWWYYNGSTLARRFFGRKHDILLFYSKGKEWTFNADDVRVPYSEDSNWVKNWQSYPDARYAPDKRGKLPHDVFSIPSINNMAKERTGYPTQKPLALYKRMIAASSNPGDMVLDPFAGCATTCVAAEQLGREWIGIDIREEAGEVIFDRLQNEVINGSMAWNDIVRVLTDAPERTDDGEPAAPELILEPSSPQEPKMSKQEAKVKLLEMDGDACLGCGWVPHHTDYLEVDHKQPKSKKGRDTLRNFGLLCGPCNLRKGAKYSLAELRDIRIAEGRMDMKWYEREGKYK